MENSISGDWFDKSIQDRIDEECRARGLTEVFRKVELEDRSSGSAK